MTLSEEVETTIEETIEQYRPLAYKVTQSLSFGMKHHFDDLHSAAMIGLWEVAKKRSTVSGNFKHFVSKSVRYSVLNEINSISPLKKSHYQKIKDGKLKGISTTSIDSFDKEREYIKNSFLDEVNSSLGTVESSEGLILDKEKCELLIIAVEALSEKQRIVITKLFFNEESPTKVRKDLKCSSQNVLKIKNNALKT